MVSWSEIRRGNLRNNSNVHIRGEWIGCCVIQDDRVVFPELTWPPIATTWPGHYDNSLNDAANDRKDINRRLHSESNSPLFGRPYGRKGLIPSDVDFKCLKRKRNQSFLNEIFTKRIRMVIYWFIFVYFKVYDQASIDTKQTRTNGQQQTRDCVQVGPQLLLICSWGRAQLHHLHRLLAATPHTPSDDSDVFAWRWHIMPGRVVCYWETIRRRPSLSLHPIPCTIDYWHW